MDKAKIGEMLQYRISETEYRPLLVIKVSESGLVAGFIFLDLWSDDKSTLHIGIGAGDWKRYVTAAQSGEGIGTWRRIP